MSTTERAATDPLGPAEVRVHLYNLGEKFLILVLASGLLFGLLLLLGAYLQAKNPTDRLLLVGGGVTGAILLAAWVFRLIRVGRQVTVHRDGVEVATALRTRRFRWDDLERVWERIVSHYMNGVHQRTDHSVQLEDSRGREVRFRGDPMQMTEIAAVIMERAHPPLAAKILERFDAGKPIKFGPITADEDGLKTGWRKQLPWSDVAEVRSENGELGIFRRGSRDPWFIVPFGDVPNYRVLVGLARHAIRQNAQVVARTTDSLTGRSPSTLPNFLGQAESSRPMLPTEVARLQRQANSLQSAAIFLAFLGVGAGVGGVFWLDNYTAEVKLREMAKPTPTPMTTAELFQNGPKDNLHVRLTDLTLDKCYAVASYRKKYSDQVIWTHVYIPAYPRAQAAAQPALKLLVRAELTSREAVAYFSRQTEATGYLTQAIWPLSARDKEVLQETFPRLNTETVMVLDVAPRAYPAAVSPVDAWLILGLLLCCPGCLIGCWIVGRRGRRAKKQIFGLIDSRTNQPLRRAG